MTVEEAKALLRIEDTSKDAYLSAILPLLIEYVQRHCNQSFENEEGQVELPGGVKIAVAKLAEHHMKEAGVQSESLARHSQTFSLMSPRRSRTCSGRTAG